MSDNLNKVEWGVNDIERLLLRWRFDDMSDLKAEEIAQIITKIVNNEKIAELERVPTGINVLYSKKDTHF